jgi:predicted lipoprotein with Yx(FWY)xxD motif
MFLFRRAAHSVALGAAVLLVGACAGKSTATGSTAGSTATTKAPAAASVVLRASSLGAIVVDASGKTLYRFDHDTAGSGTSACTGSCASTWSPARVSGPPTAGAGVAGILAVITRGDGTMQLTLDGHPLYNFSGDLAAGDTNGNGVGGIWHVVSGGSSTTSSSTSTTSRTPYGY